MQLTAELSLYPFADDHIPVIAAFIERLRAHDDLVVVTNAMSTQIRGDYERVFAVVAAELRRSRESDGKLVLVCKLIPGELAIADPPRLN